MFEILSVEDEQLFCYREDATYERTLEKSLEGDMTKLSAEGDHDIKCCILWSSNILLMRQSRRNVYSPGHAYL
jgi:hypothetical protein